MSRIPSSVLAIVASMVLVGRSASGQIYVGYGPGSNETSTFNSGTLSGAALYVGYRGNGTFQQNGGMISGALFLGCFEGANGSYLMNGGMLDTTGGAAEIGFDGIGTFIQDGGTFLSDLLSVAESTTSSGTFILNGAAATVISNNELIARHNRGTFIQSAGLHQAQSSVVGYLDRGQYDLSGGSFNVASELDLGLNGWGTFNQSAGAVTVGTNSTNGILLIGAWAGTYSLSSDSASLSVWGDEYLGNRQGTFHQSAGSHFVSGNLTASGFIQGQYLLDGGSLEVGGSELIGTYYEPSLGSYDPGLFIQTGGTNLSHGDLLIGAAGIYNLSGGTLSTPVLNIADSGSFAWSGGELSVGTLFLDGNMSLSPGSGRTLRVNSFEITQGSAGKLDLADNNMIIDYAPDQSPRKLIEDLRDELHRGAVFTSLNTNGHRIGYADNAIAGLASFSGRSVDPTSILIQYTFAGDANLDGQVDFTDLSSLAANWNSSALWTGGDFDYDGFVDIADLKLLAPNWNGSVDSLRQDLAQLGLPDVTVPEPTVVGLGGLLVCMVLQRR